MGIERVVVTLGLPNNVEKFSSFLPPFVMLMFMGALGPDEIAGAGMGFMFGNVSGAAYPLPDLPLVALSLSFFLSPSPSISVSLFVRSHLRAALPQRSLGVTHNANGRPVQRRAKKASQKHACTHTMSTANANELCPPAMRRSTHEGKGDAA